MSVSTPTLVAQNEIINPGHGLTSGADSIALTLGADIPPATPGDGAALVVYLVAGWINLAKDPVFPGDIGVKDTGYAVSDDVTNPGGGFPSNAYYQVMGNTFDKVYSADMSGGAPFATQGGQSIVIVGADATWGYQAGDTITFALNDTFDYLAAYAYLYRGDGVIPFYIESAPQIVTLGDLSQSGTGPIGEFFLDASLIGGAYSEGGPIGGLFPSPFAGEVYGDTLYGLSADQKLLALTVLQGGEWLLGPFEDYWNKPATLVQDTDDIVDDLSVWTPEILKQIAAGDCNVNTALIYKFWSQTYPGASQAAVPIVQFESSPSRRVSDADGVFAPGGGIYVVKVVDFLPPVPQGPAFNRVIPV